MMGIIIITVVCCAVATSIIWVVIIYQTRKRLTPSAGNENEGSAIDFNDKTVVHFTDNVSDRSSCKDSGTGDSAKRSNDDLVPEEYNLIINEGDLSQPRWGQLRIANSLLCLPPDPTNSHTPLLHYDGSHLYIGPTNHDRAEPLQNDDTTSDPEAPHVE